MKLFPDSLGALVLAVCWCSGALSGCSFIGRDIGDPLGARYNRLEREMAQADRVKVGDVIDVLGPPSRLGALPFGGIMLYEHVDVSERQLGVNLSAVGFNFLKLATGKGQVRREALVVVFDSRGVVESYHFERWKEEPGSGTSLQLFFAVVPTVNTDDLAKSQAEHEWGMSLLESLPVALNADKSLRGSGHGLELRGTPGGAGQRSLELGSGAR